MSSGPGAASPAPQSRPSLVVGRVAGTLWPPTRLSGSQPRSTQPARRRACSRDRRRQSSGDRIPPEHQPHRREEGSSGRRAGRDLPAHRVGRSARAAGLTTTRPDISGSSPVPERKADQCQGKRAPRGSCSTAGSVSRLLTRRTPRRRAVQRLQPHLPPITPSRSTGTSERRDLWDVGRGDRDQRADALRLHPAARARDLNKCAVEQCKSSSACPTGGIINDPRPAPA